MVTIAILAKDKAHTLPTYLECIENQTWPKSQTNLYIRTNNNNDDTAVLLKNWLKKVRSRYKDIYFDDSDVPERVQDYKQHEWNELRLEVLKKIRQESMLWAKKHNSHYFVGDCDNFIISETIETLVKTRLPIVAPLLRTGNNLYSNYHACIDENGYYQECPIYHILLSQQAKGLIQVPVVHCTYLVRKNVIDYLSYNDDSARYDYVVFSNSARDEEIPQYLDTRKIYGRITFAETKQQFEQESWLHEFRKPVEQVKETMPASKK